MGMRVIAIDGGEEKEQLCKKLGAEVFIDYTKVKDIVAEVLQVTTHGAHGAVVLAANKASYEQAPQYLRPNGTMVAVGLPADPSTIAGASPMLMTFKRLKIVGSISGCMKDIEEALDFTARGLVRVRTSLIFLLGRA